MQIEIREVSHDHSEFLMLCGELDSFLNGAIGGEDKREKYKKFNHADTMDFVAIVYDGGEPVGCGALRKYSEEEAEIKRVFVRATYRGKNVGGMLVEKLIAQAEKMGFRRLILETGAFWKHRCGCICVTGLNGSKITARIKICRNLSAWAGRSAPMRLLTVSAGA